MLSILEHYHQVCQMPNIWHLAHQTPNTNPHQVFQISKIWHEATVHSQIWDGTNNNAIIFLLILFTFSLSSQHISLSLSLCLQHISVSLCLVLSSPSLFLFHHTTPISPRHIDLTTPCSRASYHHHTMPCCWASYYHHTMPRHAAKLVVPSTTSSKPPTIGSCCEILKYSQVYKPYRSIIGQERGQTHKDLNEHWKIN